MANITQVHRGQAIKYNGETQLILELNHRTPPNLRAFVQVKMRNLSNGKISEHRMTPNDSVEMVPLSRENYEYSYADNAGYHFIHPETYDDVAVPEDLVAPIKNYLIENASYELLFTNEIVASITVPPSIDMVITEAPEGVKGDSANNVYKAATTETGLIVQVPLFIKPGEKIRVKTEDGSYMGRA